MKDFKTVREVFEAMHGVYSDTRQKMHGLWDAEERLNAKIKETQNNRLYTAEAKSNEVSKLMNELHNVRDQLEDASANCRNQLAAIMQDAQRGTVGAKYRPSLETFDTKALQMFDSGILSPAEMLSFCDDNNISDIATRRAIGKRMCAIADSGKLNYTAEDCANLAAMGYNLQQHYDAFGDYASSLNTVFTAATRPNKELSDGIADNVLPESAEAAFAWADTQ